MCGKVFWFLLFLLERFIIEMRMIFIKEVKIFMSFFMVKDLILNMVLKISVYILLVDVKIVMLEIFVYLR